MKVKHQARRRQVKAIAGRVDSLTRLPRSGRTFSQSLGRATTAAHIVEDLGVALRWLSCMRVVWGVVWGVDNADWWYWVEMPTIPAMLTQAEQVLSKGVFVWRPLLDVDASVSSV